MSTRVADNPISPVPAWPHELKLLLGGDASGLLRAVAETAGGEIASWRPRQVDHQPGRFTVVQYRVNMSRLEGEPTSETFVAATGERIPASGAAVFDDGETQVGVWRWQDDPFLPGLRDALDPGKVARLLDDLGIGGGPVRLATRAYRPARRAVVEATGRRGRLFLKVVPPRRVEDLHELHRLLTPHLPAPESLGWTAEGVVVLSALPGQTLRQALRSGQVPPPAPEAVIELLDQLPPILARRPPRRDLLSSAEHHADVIAATVPGTQEILGDLLEATRSSVTPEEVTAVHGDLYEAQVLVERGRISGLLDVDTTGPGHRVDDLANFCAHLSVLALMSDRPKRIRRYQADLLDHFESRYTPERIRPRIAAAVVGLATGPFRVLESNWQLNTVRRLELARQWLDGVGQGD